MELVSNIIELYKDDNWQEIIAKYHDHPDKNKLLWVYPSEENFEFIKKCLVELNCSGILSVGCGSGLLEWMINKATGIPVTGIEIDDTWWNCKHAPPTFIPLHFTYAELDKDTIKELEKDNKITLLFCYFNDRKAFDQYLKYFIGKVLIIIGPHQKGVHTDPLPFDDIAHDWELHKYQEIRSSGDFIVVYKKL